MTRHIAVFALALPLTALLQAEPPSTDAGAESPLTVRLYDYAKPGDRILSHAKQEAVRTLGSVGIGVRWLDCPLTMEELRTNRACDAPTGPTDLVIRLLAPQMREEVSSETGTFGYALVGDNPMPRTASVLFGNVERLAWQRDQDSSYGPVHRSISHERYVGILLGHVTAHEIGHLLLGSNRHSRRGLMQAHWNANATRDAVLGRLLFEAGEEKKIRRQMERRLDLETSKDDAPVLD